MNKLMSLIRVGMGGLAGPVLFLLLTTVAANALPGMADLNKSAGDRRALCAWSPSSG